jgi:DNA-binding transcriptional regulator WhiA
MSFSSNVKNEILCLEIENECCRHAFAYGMLLLSRAFSYYDMYLLTEHEGVAEKYAENIRHITIIII